jgi:hypothetical protein
MGIVKKNGNFVEKYTEYYHQNGKEVILVNYEFSLLDQPDSTQCYISPQKGQNL